MIPYGEVCFVRGPSDPLWRSLLSKSEANWRARCVTCTLGHATFRRSYKWQLILQQAYKRLGSVNKRLQRPTDVLHA